MLSKWHKTHTIRSLIPVACVVLQDGVDNFQTRHLQEGGGVTVRGGTELSGVLLQEDLDVPPPDLYL